METKEGEAIDGSSSNNEPPKKMMKVGEQNLVTDVKMTKTMVEYFGRDVKPVELPEKVENDETYPGLILDGASGVGKTQQVFALLKSGSTVVYRLLTQAREQQQKIYRDMRVVVDANDYFLDLVKNAVTEMKSRVENDNTSDPFSVNFLMLESCNSKNENLQKLILHFCQTLLKYDDTTKTLRLHRDQSNLNDIVLFLDEVSPKNFDDESQDRLRFLRNLGRSLEMRVVLAGTAATAANMIHSPINVAQINTADSRVGIAENGWMVIEFVYNHVPLQLPEKLNAPPMYLERPLFISLFDLLKTTTDWNSQSDKQIVQYLTSKIKQQKSFSDDSVLIWLCGPWLDSGNKIPTSPFLLTPADLVRGHFFEPAFALRKGNSDTNLMFPYFGRGICDTKTVMGNIRIFLNVEQYDGEVWWSCGAHFESNVLNSETEMIESAKSKGFFGIQYCLSNCVQICLAKEPLMAICLSNVRCNNFQDTFSRLWQETLLQGTLDAVDGKLNEYAIFGAIQLASRSDEFMETKTVKDMVESLHEMLYVSPDYVRRKKPTISYGDKNSRASQADYDLITKKFEGTKMPWLVPACSLDSLKKAFFEKCGRTMFTGEDWNIAGLVPGERNSRMDAKAYLWADPITLAWTFEFRCRSSSYSLDAGIDDLENTCSTIAESKAHAMLVAVSGSKKSEIGVWLVGEMLRVVLVVGCG